MSQPAANLQLDPATPAIDLDALTVRYGEFVAVDTLSLQVRQGELFGLLGPNGAGKSTTIRVLIGQRRPAGGRVRILGHDLHRQWDTIKPLFGYMPDRENHFDEFTGRQNLRFFADLYRLPTPAARVDDCLRAVELDEAADVKVGGYSMGMRRKLMLARTLLHDPPVMYLDEPTANLDVHSVEVVHRILRQRVAAGKTVLLTTHDMDEVEAICDRVGILCRGKLIALDTPLNLRRTHEARLVDVALTDGTRHTFDLDLPTQREQLAGLVAAGRVADMKTRHFDFHAAFLKLTGTEFD